MEKKSPLGSSDLMISRDLHKRIFMHLYFWKNTHVIKNPQIENKTLYP